MPQPIPSPWFNSYPAGVPHEVDIDAYSSVVEVFEEATAEFASKPAFHNFGKTISYAELDHYSKQLASFLQNQLNMHKESGWRL